MKALKEVNLEYTHPTCDKAIDELKAELKNARQSKIGCIVFIHGYGSSGVGGVIRKKARQLLDSRKRKGELKRVVYGEEFTIFNADAREIKNSYPKTAVYIGGNNHGVTIVEL